jgi:hypothetical protein
MNFWRVSPHAYIVKEVNVFVGVVINLSARLCVVINRISQTIEVEGSGV